MDYDFVLKGLSPALVHADDVMESDTLSTWRKDPKNKSVSVPGDDRSPAWTWQTYLYHDGEHLTIPQENIMAALRYAGAKIPSKGQTTFKAMSQSGLLILGDHCEFRNGGKRVRVSDVMALRDRPFPEHIKGARALGFDLSVKRASVGTAKHVRVRPKFEDWEVRGTIAVNEPAITESVLAQLFDIAGRLAGLGDWRPSSPKKPGPFGMFTSSLSPHKARKAG